MLGPDSAAPVAAVADFMAAAVAVAAQEKDQAPFPDAHSRPSTRTIFVRSTPPELSARKMERQTVGVDRLSKGFKGWREKEERSSARKCRPLEVNALSTTHANDGVLWRWPSDGKTGRSGSRGGRLKGRCNAKEEERAAQGGSGMAADKKEATANKGGM